MANEILPFALAVGADVMSQADYDALAARLTGFQSGIAVAVQLNKVWRQSSFVATTLAQLVADTLSEDVLDDADIAAFQDQLSRTIQALGANTSSRVVTSSAPLAILVTDYAVGLDRSAGLGAIAITLPTNATVAEGQSFVIQDLSGNLALYPATVTPSSGTIAGLANFVMNQNRQSTIFRYYGSNLWGVQA